MNIVSAPLRQEGLTVLLATLVQEGCTRKTKIFEATRSCHTSILGKNSKAISGKDVRTSGKVRFIYYSRKGILTRRVNCGRNPTTRSRRLSRRESEASERRTEKHPGLIESRRISILGRCQKVFGVRMNLFTRMKITKTGPVNGDNAERRTNSLHVFLPAQAYLIYRKVRGL